MCLSVLCHFKLKTMLVTITDSVVPISPVLLNPVIVSLIVDYGPVWHPIVTNPLGRFTLHSHCGNSGS